jgi:outer membrane protein assembly factor BamB
MIECEDYNFFRIQPADCKLQAPLKLVKQWDFGHPQRLVYPTTISNGLLYMSTPENVRTVSCYRENDHNKVWEGRERVRNYPLILNDCFMMHDDSEGMDEKEFFVLVDPKTGQVLEERRDIPICWRPAVNSNNFYGIKERPVTTASERHFYVSVLCFSKDLSEKIWESEEQEVVKYNHLSATDDYLVGADGLSQRDGIDVRTGELLWRIDPYILGIFKNEDEFWNKGSGGDIVEHGVQKRLRFSIGMPAIYGDTVVTSMYGNHMVGVDARTGDARWINYLEYSNNLRYQAYGDHLYTQGGRYIEIHKLGDGQLVERIEIDPEGLQTFTGNKNISTEMCDFTVSETHVFGTQWGSRTFFSVEKSTGKIDWAFQAENEIHSGDRPYIHNGRIYFRTRGALFIFEGVDGYLG